MRGPILALALAACSAALSAPAADDQRPDAGSLGRFRSAVGQGAHSLVGAWTTSVAGDSANTHAAEHQTNSGARLRSGQRQWGSGEQRQHARELWRSADASLEAKASKILHAAAASHDGTPPSMAGACNAAQLCGGHRHELWVAVCCNGGIPYSTIEALQCWDLRVRCNVATVLHKRPR